MLVRRRAPFCCGKKKKIITDKVVLRSSILTSRLVPVHRICSGLKRKRKLEMFQIFSKRFQNFNSPGKTFENQNFKCALVSERKFEFTASHPPVTSTRRATPTIILTVVGGFPPGGKTRVGKVAQKWKIIDAAINLHRCRSGAVPGYINSLVRLSNACQPKGNHKQQ